MADVSGRSQGPCVLQDLDNNRIALPDCFADQFCGQSARRALGLEKFPRRVNGAVDRQAIRSTDDVVLGAVSGRGVDGSSALFERDMVCQDTEGIALQEGMAEDGFVHLFARKGRE